MKLSFRVFAFFMCLLLFLDCVRSDIIRSSCDAAVKSSPNLSYDFCVASLGANPRSRNANLEGLVVIGMEQTVSSATKITIHAARLLKRKNFDRHTRAALRDCFKLYADAKSTLQEAIRAFKLKNYQTANVKVSSVMDASSTCEDGLKETTGAVSPLTKENNSFFQLTAMDLAFLNMFH